MSTELPTTDRANSHKRLRRLIGSPCVSRVLEALTDASLTPHDKVVVGCSGGPDSTALLVCLWLLQKRLPLAVQVVCVDHGLRASARREADLVMQVAQRLHFATRTLTVSVPQKASLQAAARQARYEALTQAAIDAGSRAVLVGHTQNDQAETLLLRLLGGTGLRGLAAMPKERPLREEDAHPTIRLIRPLLQVSRDEVLTLLAHVPDMIAPLPLSDPSNQDFRFTRAVVRHKVLPELQRASPAIVGQLGRLAEQLREDADFLDALARQALPQVLMHDSPTDEQPISGLIATVSASRLHALPKPLSTRVLTQLLGTTLASVQAHAILSLCEQRHGSRSLNLAHGLWAERRYDTLYLRRQPPKLDREESSLLSRTQWLPACGLYRIGRHTLQIRASSSLDVPDSSPLRLCLTLPDPGFPLWLRSPRPGDRLRTSAGHRKLSDVMIDAKIPRRERPSQIVLGFGEEPLWLVGIQSAVSPFLREESAVTLVVERLDPDDTAQP